jgi:hypothetical protein
MRMTYQEVTKEVQLNKDMVGNINLHDSRFKYDYKGFCSIINQVIDLCDYHYSRYGNLNFIFNEHQMDKIFNLKSCNGQSSYDVGTSFLDDFFNGLVYHEYNAHTECNYEDLKHKNFIFNSIANIKEEFLLMFEENKQKLLGDLDYIGVQIRGTDKKTEIPQIPLHNIFKHIDNALNEMDNKIFLATDDVYYLSNFKSRYGDRVIFNNENIISNNDKPVHFNNDRNLINLQVINDVYILSKSKCLYYTFSNVSYFALILGFDNFLKTINLNNLL